MRLCYVTCFLDIGRDHWSHFQRTTNKYFEEFKPLLHLFLNHPDASNHDFVIFLDKAHVHKMPSTLPPHIHLCPIDEEYMNKNCPLWRRMDKEKIIMESETYRDIVRHRLHHPEHTNPKYTLINHCKVDLVYNAISLVKESTHFAWVDFGYCKTSDAIPTQFLDLHKLQINRINYTLINPIDPTMDRNIIYNLKYAPEKVGGFFFCGNKESMVAYRDLYHRVHAFLQDNNIVDDDQHIALLCYFENPGLFAMHHLGGFHKALTAFQKGEVPNRRVSEITF